MLGFIVVAALIVQASALTNYCTVSGTSCTATNTCASGLTCAYRDSVNKVCCSAANLGCADLKSSSTGVSDCSSKVALCTNSAYRTLITQQCPATCKLCTTCVDQINPSTGTSDCPARALAGYCTQSAYATLMRQQCPFSCGYCSGK
ncbi:unnamed protein product, partial [Mesorhabditis belari]|uniref:ShKT domain-containing protein n=1 Tax=Mesorhabditis belari TaxID=2138241 RepID=A0AAF3J331_9BILA